MTAPEELPELKRHDQHQCSEEPAEIGEGREPVQDGEELVAEIEEGADAEEHGSYDCEEPDSAQLHRVKHVAGSREPGR